MLKLKISKKLEETYFILLNWCNWRINIWYFQLLCVYDLTSADSRYVRRYAMLIGWRLAIRLINLIGSLPPKSTCDKYVTREHSFPLIKTGSIVHPLAKTLPRMQFLSSGHSGISTDNPATMYFWFWNRCVVTSKRIILLPEKRYGVKVKLLSIA